VIIAGRRVVALCIAAMTSSDDVAIAAIKPRRRDA
jgi:hypothetical protein